MLELTGLLLVPAFLVGLSVPSAPTPLVGGGGLMLGKEPIIAAAPFAFTGLDSGKGRIGVLPVGPGNLQKGAGLLSTM